MASKSEDDGTISANADLDPEDPHSYTPPDWENLISDNFIDTPLL